MKLLLLGAVIGAASTIAVLGGVAYATGPLPVLFTAKIVGTDATGHTRQVIAAGNSLAYSFTPSTGAVLTLNYTSDQILCSGFGN